MAESSASYIRLVQHLIEECILFKMSREECEEALSKHANINPVITSTVWKELEKENKKFFEEYAIAKTGGSGSGGGDGSAISSAAPADHSHSHSEVLQPEVEEIQIAEEGGNGYGSP